MPTKIKVLIATGIYPPDIGGPATMVKALAKALAANDFEVKVLTYSDSGWRDNEENVIRISRNANPVVRYLKFFLAISKYSMWSDLIYVTDTYSVGYFVYLQKKLFNKKYVVRFAGDSAWEKALNGKLINDNILTFQEKKYSKKIESFKARRKKILAGADKVIAVSGFMKVIAEKIGVRPDRIKVIYNSIDFIPASQIDPEKIRQIKKHFPAGDKIIMSACRLTPWKGVDGLIKILPRLLEKYNGINLLILGDGEELANLKQLADLMKISEHVFFLGKISHDEILNYYRAADLFILNSQYEGLSHTLLEVMKAGTPIIASNIGGNPEVITDEKDGLLVEYNNLDQLFSAVVKILGDNLFSNQLVANAKASLRRFDWKENIKQTIDLLKSI